MDRSDPHGKEQVPPSGGVGRPPRVVWCLVSRVSRGDGWAPLGGTDIAALESGQQAGGGTQELAADYRMWLR